MVKIEALATNTNLMLRLGFRGRVRVGRPLLVMETELQA